MFEGLLIHRATIKRRLVDRYDRFGQPLETHESLHTIQCRLSLPSGGETSNERSIELYEVTHRLYCRKTVDVLEDDIVDVFDKGGNLMLGDARVLLKKVVFDGVGPHHLELTLQSQRGPM